MGKENEVGAAPPMARSRRRRSRSRKTCSHATVFGRPLSAGRHRGYHSQFLQRYRRHGVYPTQAGTNAARFAKIEPLPRCIGSEVTLCGETGRGQVVKLINNTLFFEHVAALAEMMVVAERAGMTPDTLIDAVSKCSAVEANGDICFDGENMRTAYITLSGYGTLLEVNWPRPAMKLVHQGGEFRGLAQRYIGLGTPYTILNQL